GVQDPTAWGVVVLAALAAALYSGFGVAWHLRHEQRTPRGFSTLFVSAGAVLATASALGLFRSDTARGVAVLVVGLAFGAAAAHFFRRVRTRDLSALLAAIA